MATKAFPAVAYSAPAHRARVTVEYLRQLGLGHSKIYIARSLAT